MQKRIDEIQSKYREWCELLPQLEADIARWKHAASLMQDMDDFYTNEYQACHQAIEEGANVDLRTQGEYSIMSEDALWNALGEFSSTGLGTPALKRKCFRQIPKLKHQRPSETFDSSNMFRRPFYSNGFSVSTSIWRVFFQATIQAS